MGGAASVEGDMGNDDRTRLYCHECEGITVDPQAVVAFNCQHCGSCFVEETHRPPPSESLRMAMSSLRDPMDAQELLLSLALVEARQTLTMLERSRSALEESQALAASLESASASGGVQRHPASKEWMDALPDTPFCAARHATGNFTNTPSEGSGSSGGSGVKGNLGGEVETMECVICSEEFSEGEMVKAMPCRHLFHEHCLFAWLKLQNSCPTCRHEVPAEKQPEPAAAELRDSGPGSLGASALAIRRAGRGGPSTRILGGTSRGSGAEAEVETEAANAADLIANATNTLEALSAAANVFDRMAARHGDPAGGGPDQAEAAPRTQRTRDLPDQSRHAPRSGSRAGNRPDSRQTLSRSGRRRGPPGDAEAASGGTTSGSRGGGRNSGVVVQLRSSGDGDEGGQGVRTTITPASPRPSSGSGSRFNASRRVGTAEYRFRNRAAEDRSPDRPGDRSIAGGSTAAAGDGSGGGGVATSGRGTGQSSVGGRKVRDGRPASTSTGAARRRPGSVVNTSVTTTTGSSGTSPRAQQERGSEGGDQEAAEERIDTRGRRHMTYRALSTNIR